MELEDDFHKNQKKFWKSVKGQSNGNAEVETIVKKMGKLLEDMREWLRDRKSTLKGYCKEGQQQNSH